MFSSVGPVAGSWRKLLILHCRRKNIFDNDTLFTQIPFERAHAAQLSSSTGRNESRQVCMPRHIPHPPPLLLRLPCLPFSVEITPLTLNFFFISFSFFSLSFCSFFSLSCFSFSSFFSLSRRCFSFFFSSFSSGPSAAAFLSLLQEREKRDRVVFFGRDSSLDI